MTVVFKNNLKEAVSTFIGDERHKLTRNLTESELQNVSRDVVINVLKKAKNYMMDASIFNDVQKTKGDITKHPDYKNFKESMSVIKRLNSKSGSLQEAFSNIEAVHKFLIQNKQSFEAGFKSENLNLTMFYNSLVVNMLGAGIVLISHLSQSFYKEESFLLQSSDAMQYEMFLSSIDEMADKIRDGSADTFVRKTLKQEKQEAEALTESIVLPTLFGFAIGILWYIRDIIFYAFKLRYEFSKWLKGYGDFLKLRSYQLEKSNREVAKKQRDIAESMLSLADTVSVETKVAGREVAKETKEDNKRLQKSASASTDVLI